VEDLRGVISVEVKGRGLELFFFVRLAVFKVLSVKKRGRV